MTEEFNSTNLGLAATIGRTATAANNYGTLINPSATSGAKGAWVALSASTPFDIVELEIATYASMQTASQTTGGAMDIGVGPSGYEMTIVSNIVLNSAGQYAGGNLFIGRVPLRIPSGSRVAARSSWGVAAGTNYISVYCRGFHGSLSHDMSLGFVETNGFVTATSCGTPVTPSATASTKGSYAQITAATTFDYAGIFCMADMQNAAGSAGSAYAIDIAVGASGSEIILIPDWLTAPSNQSFLNIGAVYPYTPCRIPAGTRIAARAMCTNASAIATGVTVYGVSL